jgi:hypothetical protein
MDSFCRPPEFHSVFPYIRRLEGALFVPSTAFFSTPESIAERLAAVGLAIDRRVPRGTIPGGEAGVVHRGGGRYMSIIGRNALFHNPADRGPEAVDPSVIARFAAVFTTIAKTLAGG